MRAYADTSFLISLYIPDERTPRAIACMESHREALPFTPHHRHELRNAIRLLVWAKRISAADRVRAFREIEEDLEDQLFLIHTTIDHTDVYRRADKIGGAHNEQVGCRSSDLFHVASAFQLGFKQFLTFDQKQLAIAGAAGLKVDF